MNEEKIKLAWMPLYLDQLIGGIQGFTAAEFGAYMFLLIYQFENGYVPEDRKELKKIARINGATLDNVLKKFKKTGDGKLENKTCAKVRKEQLEKYSQRVERAKKGAQAKHKQSISTAQAEHKHTEERREKKELNTTPIIPKAFDDLKEFYNQPYEAQKLGFKEMYSKQEYQAFQKFLTAMLFEFEEQLKQKFDRLLNIGEWLKILKGKGYMIVRPWVVKVIGAAPGDREQMAARIATYAGNELSEKVLDRNA